MRKNDRYKKIALMCRDVLDTNKPYSWDLSDREKDITIDLLMRAVLGFVEADGKSRGDLDYIEVNFYGAYNIITGKEIFPQ